MHAFRFCTDPSPALRAGRILAVVGCLAGATTTTWADPGTDFSRTLTDQVNQVVGLRASTLVQLDHSYVKGQPVEATLDVAGERVTLDLVPHSVRADGYKVYHVDETGRQYEVEPGPVNTLRGVVRQNPGSIVAGGVMNDGLYAIIDFTDGERYHLEPIKRRMPEADPGLYVVYHEDDVISPEGACGIDETMLPAVDEQEGLGDSGLSALGGPAFYTAELAIDADFQYFQDWGMNTEDRVNLVIGAVNVQYETEVEITHAITAIVIRTSNGQNPYSTNNAGNLLSQFRNEWLSNQSSIPRDVAHLFTGRELNGGTIGIAWTIGGICTSGAYCLSQSDCCGSFGCSTDLTAHELGHLWNGFHCDCTSPGYTMNPFILCANQFNPNVTVPSIIAHRNSRSCLDFVEPTGACCLDDGSCLGDQFFGDCSSAGGVYQGNGVVCNDINCPVFGACCVTTGACFVITPEDCLNNFQGIYQGDGTSCPQTACSTNGACCLGTTCAEVLEANCVNIGGTYEGQGTSCSSFPCPEATGACCLADGSCSEIVGSECATAGGTFSGDGSGCSPNDCPQPTGACCFADGSCSVQTGADCTTAGGTYAGDGSGCSPNDCPQPTGACCFADGSCTEQTGADCTTAGGTYSGDGSGCSPNDCPQPPSCPEDFNGDDSIGFGDLNQLLGVWGVCPGCPEDLNEDGSVGFSDLNALLELWGPC